MELREPNGHGYVFVYDNENSDPCARGNVLKITEVSSPLFPAISRDILRATYEPVHNKIKVFMDATGATTEFVYDYETMPVVTGGGLLRELRHPVVTMPDGTTRQTIESFIYNAWGQLLQHSGGEDTNTFDYYSVGPMTGYLQQHSHSAGPINVFENFEYNDVGNLTARIDGLGNRTSYTVNNLGLVTEVRAP